MTDILTVTVNPAIDVATSVDRVVAGPKLRCGPSHVDPGGGGINVARTITGLGGTANAIVAVGGATGEQLIGMVEDCGVATVAVPVTGQTRQNLAVNDAHTSKQYRFSLASDAWSPDDTGRMIQTIKAQATPGGIVVLSGGLAPGMPVGFHRDVQNKLAGITDTIIVDTCDPSLTDLITNANAPLHVLRLDHNEAALAADRQLDSISDCFDFGVGLVERGVAKIVIIGHGEHGSLLVTRGSRLFCHAATVQVVSKIGAGDAFVGAFTLRLARGEPLEYALQWGVAAASATVERQGTSLGSLRATQELLPLCRIESFSF